MHHNYMHYFLLRHSINTYACNKYDSLTLNEKQKITLENQFSNNRLSLL